MGGGSDSFREGDKIGPVIRPGRGKFYPGKISMKAAGTTRTISTMMMGSARLEVRSVSSGPRRAQ